MDYEWRFFVPGDDGVWARASGDDSASVLSLAFLTWLDGRDVDRIENEDALAGFLATHSDLGRREIAGLLGTLDFEHPDNDDRFIVRLDDTDIVLSRGTPDTGERDEV